MKHLLILSALIFACDDHKFTGGHGSETPVEGSGYEAVQTIFSNSCAGCHAQGSTPPVLDGDLCADLVGADSSVEGVPQIEAGNADNSYIMHKINNTHTDIGGGGSQMPIGGGPLGSDEIAIITDWINDGAECDSGESTSEPSEPSDPAEPTSEPEGRSGEDIHNGCMGCHAYNNFDLGDYVPEKTDAQLEMIILEGVGSMPPQNVTDNEMPGLIEFLRVTYPE